jgi:hypothetical protein
MTGTAVLNKHYTLSGSPGEVTIPAGSSSATVTLTAGRPGKKTKTATMNLAGGSGYTVSSPQNATVNISK